MSKLYTFEETLEFLNVKRPTLSKWIKEKKIRISRIGGNKNVRITEEALNEFIKNTEV